MKKIGIVGATGYTGEELLRVLARHPEVQVSWVTSEQERGQAVGRHFPHLPAFRNLSFQSVQEVAVDSVDLAFLCLPAGQSASWGGVFFDHGVKVIDLGADFRFTEPQVYKKWYGIDHPRPDLLADAVYGLPEWHRSVIKNARVVGNPGCYPTAILLAVYPFLRHGMVAEDAIIADAKSGLSGAGKSLTLSSHFVEANENMNAYKPGRSHRHVGEIEQEMARIVGKAVPIVFTPHLAPMSRGLYATVYLRLQSSQSKNELLAVLQQAYGQEPFVRVLENGLPGTRMADHSNFCFIGVEPVPESIWIILFSAIDNLGKGASWQAIQNMNLMLDLPETMGLLE